MARMTVEKAWEIVRLAEKRVRLLEDIGRERPNLVQQAIENLKLVIELERDGRMKRALEQHDENQRRRLTEVNARLAALGIDG